MNFVKKLSFLFLTLTLSSISLAAQIHSIQSFPGRVEIHVQPEVSQLDVLFVVDNSGSMSSHQNNFSKNIPTLINALIKKGIHVQAGVTSTSIDCWGNQACLGSFSGSPKIVNSDSPDFTTQLAKKLMTGVDGSGQESHFANTIRALSEPMLSSDHPGFLRPKAHLAIVYLTDADDQSDKTKDEYIGFVKSLKPNPAMISLFAFAYTQNPADYSNKCTADEPTQGKNLIEAVKELNGAVADICDADYGPVFEKIGSDISTEIIREIPLTIVPDFSSISVSIGKTILPAGELHDGWVYDSSRNVIILGDKLDWNNFGHDEIIVSFIPKDWK